ncbi:MAG TPA: PH domain-containing protein [Patescibacteria group bacterium]|nr:PH domain-containing protein [Patescibacteria group bacterium]
MPDIFTEELVRDRRFDGSESSIAQPTPEPFMAKGASLPQVPPSEKKPSPPKVKNPHKTMHAFSAFCEMPENVTFETQEPNETILLLLRKSFITNVPWIFFSLVFAILPPFVLTYLNQQSTPFILLSPSYVTVLVAFYYLIIAAYMFMSFITWFFNTSLITTERVVDIDFSEVVYKNIAETKMDLVQDVSYTQSSVIRTLFNYGDVLVQTAGTIDNFDLQAVPNPDRAVEIVEEQIGKGRGTSGV